MEYKSVTVKRTSLGCQVTVEYQPTLWQRITKSPAQVESYTLLGPHWFNDRTGKEIGWFGGAKLDQIVREDHFRKQLERFSK